MVTITAEAYEAIACTLALGTVACEAQPNQNGERLIWIEERAAAARNPAKWVLRLATIAPSFAV
jgi:hypothetical protein